MICIIKNDRHKSVKMMLACLAAFFVGGGNYISALIIAILFAVALIVAVYTRKRKCIRLVILPCIFS